MNRNKQMPIVCANCGAEIQPRRRAWTEITVPPCECQEAKNRELEDFRTDAMFIFKQVIMMAVTRESLIEMANIMIEQERKKEGEMSDMERIVKQPPCEGTVSRERVRDAVTEVTTKRIKENV